MAPLLSENDDDANEYKNLADDDDYDDDGSGVTAHPCHSNCMNLHLKEQRTLAESANLDVKMGIIKTLPLPIVIDLAYNRHRTPCTVAGCRCVSACACALSRRHHHSA